MHAESFQNALEQSLSTTFSGGHGLVLSAPCRLHAFFIVIIGVDHVSCSTCKYERQLNTSVAVH
jgi:hypothetical protein